MVGTQAESAVMVNTPLPPARVDNPNVGSRYTPRPPSGGDSGGGGGSSGPSTTTSYYDEERGGVVTSDGRFFKTSNKNFVPGGTSRIAAPAPGGSTPGGALRVNPVGLSGGYSGARGGYVTTAGRVYPTSNKSFVPGGRGSASYYETRADIERIKEAQESAGIATVRTSAGAAFARDVYGISNVSPGGSVYFSLGEGVYADRRRTNAPLPASGVRRAPNLFAVRIPFASGIDRKPVYAGQSGRGNRGPLFYSTRQENTTTGGREITGLEIPLGTSPSSMLLRAQLRQSIEQEYAPVKTRTTWDWLTLSPGRTSTPTVGQLFADAKAKNYTPKPTESWPLWDLGGLGGVYRGTPLPTSLLRPQERATLPQQIANRNLFFLRSAQYHREKAATTPYWKANPLYWGTTGIQDLGRQVGKAGRGVTGYGLSLRGQYAASPVPAGRAAGGVLSSVFTIPGEFVEGTGETLAYNPVGFGAEVASSYGIGRLLGGAAGKGVQLIDRGGVTWLADNPRLARFIPKVAKKGIRGIAPNEGRALFVQRGIGYGGGALLAGGIIANPRAAGEGIGGLIGGGYGFLHGYSRGLKPQKLGRFVDTRTSSLEVLPVNTVPRTRAQLRSFENQVVPWAHAGHGESIAMSKIDLLSPGTRPGVFTEGGPGPRVSPGRRAMSSYGFFTSAPERPAYLLRTPSTQRAVLNPSYQAISARSTGPGLLPDEFLLPNYKLTGTKAKLRPAGVARAYGGYIGYGPSQYSSDALPMVGTKSYVRYGFSQVIPPPRGWRSMGARGLNEALLRRGGVLQVPAENLFGRSSEGQFVFSAKVAEVPGSQSTKLVTIRKGRRFYVREGGPGKGASKVYQRVWDFFNPQKLTVIDPLLTKAGTVPLEGELVGKKAKSAGRSRSTPYEIETRPRYTRQVRSSGRLSSSSLSVFSSIGLSSVASASRPSSSTSSRASPSSGARYSSPGSSGSLGSSFGRSFGSSGSSSSSGSSGIFSSGGSSGSAGSSAPFLITTPRVKLPSLPFLTPLTGRGSSSKPSRRTYRYAPSLKAIDLGIRGRPTRSRGGFTGLELRPLPTRKTR